MSNFAGPTRSGVAVIDLGSNTVLLLVLDDSGRVLCEAARITRLGQGVFETGRLSPQAAERTRRAVRELVGQARAAGVERVVGVGTEALRYGQRVTVIALPAPAVFLSEAGLRHGGPGAFGYDLVYHSLFEKRAA